MRKLLLLALLALPLGAQWWCAFNPLAAGCPPTDQTPHDDRTELCDIPVPAAFTVVYGAPPAGLGCLSNPTKVTYYTNVQSWVPGSSALFEGENAEPFKEFGFGHGLAFTKSWGAYERELIAFPSPEWGRPIPVVFGPGARLFPSPYIARSQTDALRFGACIAKLHPSVVPRFAKLNGSNCKVD